MGDYVSPGYNPSASFESSVSKTLRLRTPVSNMSSIGAGSPFSLSASQYQQMLNTAGQYAVLGGYGTVMGLLSGPPQPARPTEPIGETVIVVGPYILADANDAVRLYRREKIDLPLVATWSDMPSRALVAATIHWDRQRQPRINARDGIDGSLLGVRYFKITSDYHIASPIQHTVWESEIMTAHSWDEGEAVRGVCGIHAAWPARDGRVRPKIDAKNEGWIVALVRGQGRFVCGKEGWRAERVIIDTAYLPSAIYHRWRVVKRLQRLYPSVTFEEETWTLERSLRSVASSRASCR